MDAVSNNGSTLPSSAISKCLNELLTLTSSHLYQRTREMLVNLRNVEESLKRLKPTGGTAKPSSDLSDEDKIRLQLQIDCKEYAKEAS